MADIRFLAFGGTSFRERGRFGDWSGIDGEALSDAENLRRASLAFGCGRVQDAPFLMWQELREGDRSHGYPDSLLLDLGDLPQEAPWFGQTARLLERLFAGESAGRRILAEIQKITTGEILELAQAVPGPQPEDEPAGTHSEEIVCALLAASCALPDLLAVAPVTAELAAQPLPDLVARAQGGLPPALRNGAGWAVNVRQKYASGLGLRLVIHPDGSADTAQVAAALELGRAILAAAARLPKLPGRELVEARLQRAAWTAPAEVARLANQLLALADAAAGRYQRLQAELDLLPPGEELERWLRHFLDLVMAGDEIADTVSRYLLESALRQRIALSRDVTRRLNQDALHERGLLPHELPASLQLDESDEDRLNQDSLTRSDVRLEKLLEAAEKDKPRRRKAVLSCAFGHVQEQQLELSRLDKYRDELHDKLKEAARERLKTRPAGWIADYIAYADDPALNYLEQFCSHGDTANDVVDALLNARADDLLAGIAATRIRSRLSGETKGRIVEAYRQREEWSQLATLHDLFYGVEVKTAIRPASESGRPLLVEDLRQMLKFSAPGSAVVPRLDGIYQLLGELSPILLKDLRALQPMPANVEQALAWWAGWRELDAVVFDAEIDRILLEWARTGRMQAIPLSVFSRHQAGGAALFRWLSDGRPEDPLYQQVVACIVPAWIQYPRSEEMVHGFPDQWGAEQEATFVSRVDQLGIGGEALLAKMPPKHKGAVLGKRVREAVLAAQPDGAAALRNKITGAHQEVARVIQELAEGSLRDRAAEWTERVTAQSDMAIVDLLMETAPDAAQPLAAMLCRWQPDRMAAVLQRYKLLEAVAQMTESASPAVRHIVVQALLGAAGNPLLQSLRAANKSGGGLLGFLKR